MLQNQSAILNLTIQSTIGVFIKSATIEEQELANQYLSELSVPQTQQLDDNQDVLFTVLDALVDLGLVTRGAATNSLCSGKYLKWQGLASLKHSLVDRLFDQKQVSKQELTALQISDAIVKVLLYAGVCEEVIQVYDNVQVKSI